MSLEGPAGRRTGNGIANRRRQYGAEGDCAPYCRRGFSKKCSARPPAGPSVCTSCRPLATLAPSNEDDGTASFGMAASAAAAAGTISRTSSLAHRTHAPCLSCTDARFVSRGVIRLPCAQCETGSSGSVQGWHRRASKLLLASMIGLDTLSLCATGVASWLAESRFEKREVSRHVVSYGHGHGSCDGLLCDAAMGPQRRLWSTSGLAPRLGTALGLGCYGGAMWRSWGAVVVAGVRGQTFSKNGPFTT